MAELIYANVIVDISHEKVDRPFQYRIPDRLIGKVEPLDRPPLQIQDPTHNRLALPHRLFHNFLL